MEEPRADELFSDYYEETVRMESCEGSDEEAKEQQNSLERAVSDENFE